MRRNNHQRATFAEAAAATAIVAGSVCLFLRPVWDAPWKLAIGSANGEAPRHFWGLWATATHLDTWGPFVAHLEVDFPSGYTRHLMDPINLLFFIPGYLAGGGGPQGAALGYNLVHAAWVALAGVGGWLLSRRLLQNHSQRALAALTAALICATAPYLSASPYLGRTELLPGAAWPLHLWLLERALTRGRGRDIVAAGLSLAAIALGGWYLAGWLILLEPPVALALAWRIHRDNSTKTTDRSSCKAIIPGYLWFRLAMVALLAMLPVLPALQALLEWPPPIMSEEQRLNTHMGINTPPQLLLPMLSHQGLPGVEVPAYPGAIAFALALWGAFMRPRKAAAWFLAALVLMLISLGPYLIFTNDARALTENPPRLPAWYIEKLFPPIRFIWGWCRIGILLATPLSVAAAWGMASLAKRYSKVRIQLWLIIASLLLLDGTEDRAPAGVMGRAFDPSPPTELLEALDMAPPGAILQIPLDDFYMVWQLALDRPIAESLEIEDAREQSYLLQKVLLVLAEARLSPNVPSSPDDVRRAWKAMNEMLSDPHLRSCLESDSDALARAGYAAVVLHRDRLANLHQVLTPLLESSLGAPLYNSRDLALWVPRKNPQAHTPLCPLEKVQVYIP